MFVEKLIVEKLFDDFQTEAVLITTNDPDGLLLSMRQKFDSKGKTEIISVIAP